VLEQCRLRPAKGKAVEVAALDAGSPTAAAASSERHSDLSLQDAPPAVKMLALDKAPAGVEQRDG
jgi:hypothetical protein